MVTTEVAKLPTAVGPSGSDLVQQIFTTAASKGITDMSIERATGLSHQRLWRIKKRGWPPRVDELLAMCAAVGSSLIEIAAAAEEANPPPD